MTDSIGTRLEYFQELEHATRMLNHPGESLVLQTDFLYMVERVDICIDYLKAHVSSPHGWYELEDLHMIAALPGSRDIFVTLPAVSNPSHDVDQDVLGADISMQKPGFQVCKLVSWRFAPSK